jgi:hypothetical protein
MPHSGKPFPRIKAINVEQSVLNCQRFFFFWLETLVLQLESFTGVEKQLLKMVFHCKKYIEQGHSEWY